MKPNVPKCLADMHDSTTSDQANTLGFLVVALKNPPPGGRSHGKGGGSRGCGAEEVDRWVWDEAATRNKSLSSPWLIILGTLCPAGCITAVWQPAVGSSFGWGERKQGGGDLLVVLVILRALECLSGYLDWNLLHVGPLSGVPLVVCIQNLNI